MPPNPAAVSILPAIPREPYSHAHGRSNLSHAASPVADILASFDTATAESTIRREDSPADRPPVSVSSILPKLQITTRRLRKLETICLIREQRETGKQELAYNARPFVLCGIPVRRPPRDQLAYLRRNGNFLLEITGHPRYGLPYGQDRLIPIWIATLAIRQKSRVVYFRSAAEMLEFFHMTKDGRHYRRIVEGFQRVFAATIFFGTDDQPGRSEMIDRSRFNFFERMRLWFSGVESGQADDRADNVVTLSHAFYQECNQHRIPVEREVVAALANAPGVLDFYIWLVWKTWSLRGRTARIPLLGPGSLTEQLGNAPYAVERTFRLTISRWLRVVKGLWPQCPAGISEDGHTLIVTSAQKDSAIRGRTCGNPCARAE
jgi:Plasmid encoded RepA protein